MGLLPTIRRDTRCLPSGTVGKVPASTALASGAATSPAATVVAPFRKSRRLASHGLHGSDSRNDDDDFPAIGCPRVPWSWITDLARPYRACQVVSTTGSDAF